MAPPNSSEDFYQNQRIEKIRQAALDVIRTRGRLVRIDDRGQLELRRREFTIRYHTPFNLPPPPRTKFQIMWAALSERRCRYRLEIAQHDFDAFVADWDDEREIYPRWFRDDFENPWDGRFLRYAKELENWKAVNNFARRR
jgi:hypothetical protein